MMRRRQRDQGDGITLFPFLAVLICTVGSLIVLLVVVVQQAKANGLVDELGTLKTALQKAKELAGMDIKKRVEIMELPRTPTPFEQLFGDLDESAQLKILGQVLNQQSPEVLKLLRQSWLMNLMAKEKFLTVQPFHFSVE